MASRSSIEEEGKGAEGKDVAIRAPVELTRSQPAANPRSGGMLAALPTLSPIAAGQSCYLQGEVCAVIAVASLAEAAHLEAALGGSKLACMSSNEF